MTTAQPFTNPIDAAFKFDVPTRPGYAMSLAVSFIPDPSWVPDVPALIVSDFDLGTSESVLRRIQALIRMDEVASAGGGTLDDQQQSDVLMHILLDTDVAKLLDISHPRIDADGRCHMAIETTDGLFPLATDREELRLFALRVLEWLDANPAEPD